MISCPCGGGSYPECCKPVIADPSSADTPEQIMRSRYTAYVRRDLKHLLVTWHPDTAPARCDLAASLADGTVWQGLTVHCASHTENSGQVEFTAHYLTPAGGGALRENSRFVKEAGRWLYLDGQQR
ncbi:hypothetical protein KRX56_06340 [Dermabacteraceae bacterium TAE3-ERU27]|nr:hypothetical protein [Dermabacteraceae bacterium TAE3-ERU27]